MTEQAEESGEPVVDTAPSAEDDRPAKRAGGSGARDNIRRPANLRWVFPVSVGVMLVVFVAIVVRYGDVGFSDNADVFDILQLGLLPGIIAMIPIWLMFRHKSLRLAGYVVYSLLLFAFVAVVGLGYIDQWSWATHKLGSTGQPAANLWDWLSVALLPFLIPIVTAVAAADPDPPGDHTAAPAEAAKPVPSRRAGVVLGLLPAVLCLILVGVVFSAISTAPAAAAATEPAPPSQTPAPQTPRGDAVEQMVDVPATASWTFTHIPVHKSDVLTITAAGTISFIPRGPLVGPDGDTAPHESDVCVLPTCSQHHAALIGDIDGTAPSHPFLVGAHYSATVDRDGILVLGINDVGVDNNDGSYGALVEVRTGP